MPRCCLTCSNQCIGWRGCTAKHHGGNICDFRIKDRLQRGEKSKKGVSGKHHRPSPSRTSSSHPSIPLHRDNQPPRYSNPSKGKSHFNFFKLGKYQRTAPKSSQTGNNYNFFMDPKLQENLKWNRQCHQSSSNHATPTPYIPSNPPPEYDPSNPNYDSSDPSDSPDQESQPAETVETQDVSKPEVDVENTPETVASIPHQGLPSTSETVGAFAAPPKIPQPDFSTILGDIEIPEGVDPSFLAALPEDIRQEVIEEQRRLAMLGQQPAPAAHEATGSQKRQSVLADMSTSTHSTANMGQKMTQDIKQEDSQSINFFKQEDIKDRDSEIDNESDDDDYNENDDDDYWYSGEYSVDDDSDEEIIEDEELDEEMELGGVGGGEEADTEEEPLFDPEVTQEGIKEEYNEPEDIKEEDIKQDNIEPEDIKEEEEDTFMTCSPQMRGESQHRMGEIPFRNMPISFQDEADLCLAWREGQCSRRIRGHVPCRKRHYYLERDVTYRRSA